MKEIIIGDNKYNCPESWHEIPFSKWIDMMKDIDVYSPELHRFTLLDHLIGDDILRESPEDLIEIAIEMERLYEQQDSITFADYEIIKIGEREYKLNKKVSALQWRDMTILTKKYPESKSLIQIAILLLPTDSQHYDAGHDFKRLQADIDNIKENCTSYQAIGVSNFFLSTNEASLQSLINYLEKTRTKVD